MPTVDELVQDLKKGVIRTAALSDPNFLKALEKFKQEGGGRILVLDSFEVLIRPHVGEVGEDIQRILGNLVRKP